ncbi:MAG TPA: SRPBCC family protein [Nocardioidaceae bacterium]|nr:SRPBCC family protein [Nocardioidaceae bacterium]
MTEKTADKASQAANGAKSMFDELPVDRLKDELMRGLSTLGERAVKSAGKRINGFSDKLNDVAENGGALANGGVIGKAAKGGVENAAEGDSPVAGAVKGGLSGVKDKVKEKLGGGGGKGKGSTKATNIVEEIDVGVPVDVAYNQWTQFQDWSDFMKKVDTIEQEADEQVNFKAQVFWSHRRWDATILEQVPNEKIVWRSKGEKGHVDGAVTFHEVAPNLTRILVVLEYYPQGFFEHTGNLWRAQGRRARLELKHFRRHVMTRVLLDPEQVEGWRGEIHDGEVTRSHEEALDDEQQDADEDRSDEDEDARGDEPEDEYEEDEGEQEDEEDEYDEDEGEQEDEEPEDEYEEEPEPEEQAPVRRRRAS